MTTPAPPSKPSLGMRCLRLAEAVVWPALAVALPNWPDLATPFCVLLFCASIARTTREPLVDAVPRLIRNLAVTMLAIGLAIGLVLRFLSFDAGDGRLFVAAALLVAVVRARGFALQPRWPWIVAAFAAAFVGLALDQQQRVVPDLGHPDRFWWGPLAACAVLLPLSHLCVRYGMVLARRRAAGPTFRRDEGEGA